MSSIDMSLRQQEMLWQIALVVAEKDSTYEFAGFYCCNYCEGKQRIFVSSLTEEELIRQLPHDKDCIVTKARELLKSRELQPSKEVIDVTCDQCGERYYGSLEDMRGWYGFIEQEPRRNRYAFCSEGHMKQWKADRGVE